jgi:hypothetical protein
VAAPPADRRLRDHLHGLLAALEASGWPLPDVDIVTRGDVHHLVLDGERLRSEDDAEALIGPLIHALNRWVIETSPHLMLHAGGVEHDGEGVVLPGGMESGKTTLTAGLVRAGFRYLTDEAVAIDRSSLLVQPYPKPLSLDPGSWPFFPELEPDADLASDEYKALQWQVPPEAIRADAVGRPCPVRFVIFPRHQAGAATAIEPLGRAEALVELTRHTFGFKHHARDSLALLAEVLRGAESHRLTLDGLDRAVELVAATVGAP